MLIPLLIGESMGLKRYGSISGLIALVNTLGAALGPLAAGRIFDATLSYTNAFELFMGAHVVGALASPTCRPLAAEEALPRSRCRRLRVGLGITTRPGL